jgi:hypothetical protein
MSTAVSSASVGVMSPDRPSAGRSASRSANGRKPTRACPTGTGTTTSGTSPAACTPSSRNIGKVISNRAFASLSMFNPVAKLDGLPDST